MITQPKGYNAYVGEPGPADADYVIYRLEEAGSCILALPSTGYTTKLRTSSLDIVRDTVEAFATASGRIRPPPPDARQITRMDEALGWIARIPPDRYVLRRIVGARSLVSPVTERHLFTWRRLATTLGADHKAVQRWHAQGITLIVEALNRPASGDARPIPAKVNRPTAIRLPSTRADVNALNGLRRERAGS